MRTIFTYFPKITGPLRSYFNYFFGEKEIKYFFNYLQKYKNKYVFLDIGANYGIYTFLFGKHASYVHAIEPIKECIDYIKKGYRYQNIRYFNKVLSNDNNVKSLNIPLVNNKLIFGQSSINKKFKLSEEIKINSFTLDYFENDRNILKSDLLFIKVDVEGHENSIFETTGKLLKHPKTIMMVEIEPRHNQNYKSLFKNLFFLGFDSYYLMNNKLVKIIEINDLSKIMQKNINFIFKNY